MSFLSKEQTASLISIKLTDKGREFLAKGFKDDNVFDIVKFSLGDSEVDYVNVDNISNQLVTEPMNNPTDLKCKIYASGVVPAGTPQVNLTTNQVSMTIFQSGIQVGASSTWYPVDGIYSEEYSWTNLGPLEDYDFGMSKSYDTKSVTLRAFDVIGTTIIKVQGMTSGAYALFTLTITNG